MSDRGQRRMYTNQGGSFGTVRANTFNNATTLLIQNADGSLDVEIPPRTFAGQFYQMIRGRQLRDRYGEQISEREVQEQVSREWEDMEDDNPQLYRAYEQMQHLDTDWRDSMVALVNRIRRASRNNQGEEIVRTDAHEYEFANVQFRESSRGPGSGHHRQESPSAPGSGHHRQESPSAPGSGHHRQESPSAPGPSHRGQESSSPEEQPRQQKRTRKTTRNGHRSNANKSARNRRKSKAKTVKSSGNRRRTTRSRG